MKSDICIINGCDRIRDKKQNRRICQMHRVRYGHYESNVGLGHFKYSNDLLQSAIHYLKQHQ